MRISVSRCGEGHVSPSSLLLSFYQRCGNRGRKVRGVGRHRRYYIVCFFASRGYCWIVVCWAPDTHLPWGKPFRENTFRSIVLCCGGSSSWTWWFLLHAIQPLAACSCDWLESLLLFSSSFVFLSFHRTSFLCLCLCINRGRGMKRKQKTSLCQEIIFCGLRNIVWLAESHI